jgi:hypothetical protein
MIHQPQPAVKPLGGEELLGEGDGQGAGEDLPIRIVLDAAHLSTGGVADGHGGAEQIAVDVVQGAVHAGGNPSTLLRTGPLAVGVVVLGGTPKERSAGEDVTSWSVRFCQTCIQSIAKGPGTIPGSLRCHGLIVVESLIYLPALDVILPALPSDPD